MQVIKTRNATTPFNNSKGSGVVNYDGWLEEFNTAPNSKKHRLVLFDNQSKAVVNPYNAETKNRAAESTEQLEDGSTRLTYTCYYTVGFQVPYSGMIRSFHDCSYFAMRYFVDANFSNSFALRTYNNNKETVGAYTWYSIKTPNIHNLTQSPDAPKNMFVPIDEAWFFVQKGEGINVMCSILHVPRELTENPLGDFDPYFDWDEEHNLNKRLLTNVTLHYIE